MSEIKVIIIDDEYHAVRCLEKLFEKYFPGVKLLANTTNPAQGLSFIKTLKPDLLFIDIHMPHMNGLQLVEGLAERDFHIVFTTAYREYALKALKLQAADYLLKPIALDELGMTINRVMQLLEMKKQKPVERIFKELLNGLSSRIAIPGKSHIEYVQMGDIVYVEANSNSSQVLTSEENRIICTNRSLKDYEEVLCRENSPFIRIHNSFLINVNHATKYIREDGGYVVMKENKTIPISKQKKDEFLRMINL